METGTSGALLSGKTKEVSLPKQLAVTKPRTN
jgi:hypothetical protein